MTETNFDDTFSRFGKRPKCSEHQTDWRTDGIALGLVVIIFIHQLVA